MRNVTQVFRSRPVSTFAAAPYAAFAAFGMFWGAWGAALPSIRAQAGLGDGQLGTALLFVGAGALPAMLVTGPLLDRLGTRLSAVLLVLLAGAGITVAMGAQGFTSVVVGMLLVGATSGAADVSINTLAAHVEHRTSRAVLTRSHGVFSLAVVASSLGTGAMLTRNLSLAFSFVLVAATILALAALVLAGAPEGPAPQDGAEGSTVTRKALGTPGLHALILLGLIGALAHATENAHQSWGAVFMTDIFAASPQLASFAPATFAAAATLARFVLAPLSRSHPTALLLAGGALATTGSVVLATSHEARTALLGLAIAAVGTAVLLPTLLSHSLRHIESSRRGRATSVITTAAYLGFLLGPAYVGLLADIAGLRLAIIGVAALALAFTIAAAPASRFTHRVLSPRRHHDPELVNDHRGAS